MAQKKTARKTGIEYGTSGVGKLTKIDKDKARIELEEGKTINFDVVLGNVFENENATLPDYVPFKSMKDGASINVRVSFEKGDKRILFINPSAGELRVKFSKFQAPEDSAPSWTEKEGKGKKTYRECNPFVEVTEGKWKGLLIRGRLFDNFGRDEEDGKTTIFFGKKSTSSDNLADFCACVGFEYWDVEFTENHLPQIQKVALENDNEFSVMLINGYIATWIPGLGEEDAFEKDFPEPKDNAEKLLED